MPDPRPIHPRVAQARAYARELMQSYLQPILVQLRQPLLNAAYFAEAIRIIDEQIAPEIAVPQAVVDGQIAALNTYHREAFIRNFRRALGVDVSEALDDARPITEHWRRENVRLIRTIPQRLHDDLIRRMEQMPAFDEQALADAVRTEFRVSGYNVRRIARDQTNKAIGQFTRYRQEQVGVERYIWRTVGDERVRRAHQALDGTEQRWDTPTGEGFPGDAVQCRCVASPLVNPGFRAAFEQAPPR